MKYENGFLIAEDEEEWYIFYQKILDYSLKAKGYTLNLGRKYGILDGTCSHKLRKFNANTMYKNILNRELSPIEKEIVAWIESYYKFDFWDIEL